MEWKGEAQQKQQARPPAERRAGRGGARRLGCLPSRRTAVPAPRNALRMRGSRDGSGRIGLDRVAVLPGAAAAVAAPRPAQVVPDFEGGAPTCACRAVAGPWQAVRNEQLPPYPVKSYSGRTRADTPRALGATNSVPWNHRRLAAAVIFPSMKAQAWPRPAR